MIRRAILTVRRWRRHLVTSLGVLALATSAFAAPPPSVTLILADAARSGVAAIELERIVPDIDERACRAATAELARRGLVPS